MTDDRENKNTDPKEALRLIAERTRSFRNTRAVSLLTEICCYLLFLGFVALAFYLPGYLEMKLDAVEEEIGFYTLDPEDRKLWKLLLQLGLVVMSFFPLVTGILFRAMARMNRVLKEVNTLSEL